jgi:hypothetical protein
LLKNPPHIEKYQEAEKSSDASSYKGSFIKMMDSGNEENEINQGQFNAYGDNQDQTMLRR